MTPSSLRLSAVSVLIALLAVGCGGPRELAGFVRDPAPDVSGHTLPEVTADGSDYRFVAPDDGLLVVYFGYTHCPDVCPTTMSDLRNAVADLGEGGERVDVAMATIDPSRDTPEVISNYVQAFFEDGHALRTEDDSRLSTVTSSFGAAFNVEEMEDGTIEVVHTGHTYVVDDQGVLRVTWPFGTTEEDMTSDMQLLLEQA